MIITRRMILRRSALLLGTSIVVVIAAAFFILVDITVEQKREQLVELARSQARLMESVAMHDAFFRNANGGPPARITTLSQIKEAHLSYRGFGRTGELVLAERVDDEIVFLLPLREAGFKVPDPVPFSSTWAEPMRRALNGQSGTVNALDYSGDQVLAAYEPLEFLGVGIVAKMDVAEIYAPFYWAGLISAGVALVVIGAGLLISLRTVGPLIDTMSHEIAERQAAEEQLQRMVDSSPVAIGFSVDSVVRFVNPKAREYLGAEVGQPTPNMYVNIADRDEIVARLAAEGGIVNYDIQMYNRNHEVRDYLATYLPYRYGGDDGLLVWLLDITDRRRAERELHEAKLHLEERVIQRTEEVQQSERRFRHFIEKAPVGILITDVRTGAIIEANEAIIRILGYASREAIMQVNAQDLYPQSGDREKLLASLSNGQVAAWQSPFHRQDGTEFWARCSAVMQFDTAGNAQVATVCEDITEARAAEEELLRMSNVFRHAADPIVIEDLNGFITDINEEVAESYGWSRDELIGQAITKLIPPEDHELATDLRRRCIAGEEVRGIEGRRWHRDGSALPVLRTLSLLRNADGDPMAIASFTADITKLKQVEQELHRHQQHLEDLVASRTKALAETEGLFRNTFELAAVGIAHVGKDGSWLRVNERICQIVGYSREELLQSTFQDITYPEDLNADLEQFNALMAKRIPHYAMEKRYVHKDGHLVWINLTVALVCDEAGEPDYFISVIEDIALRKRMEQETHEARQLAEQATRAKSDFLARMSHEIRTPMNAVIGMNHLALQTELTAKQRDYISKSLTSARSLLAIINDILDYSKIEAGKMNLETVEFQIEEVLDGLSTMNLIRAEEKGLELIFNASPDIPATLLGDPHRLGQILVNLVSNAIKFTDHGEILVSIKVLERSADSVSLQFDVQDSGIGLTEDQIARLFQSFEQADGSTTRKYGGTGLGLAICKNLAEMMGGRIWVESVPGEGSTFSFTTSLGCKADSNTPRFIPVPDLHGLKALVVDDSAISRDILGGLLESFTFLVNSVDSGAAALEELKQASAAGEPYRLVLMDWKMPGMNGIEAALRIRSEEGIAHTPQILMVSAHGSEEVIQQAQKARLRYFLTKPVSSSVLFDTVMECFGQEAQRTPSRTHHPFASDEPLLPLRGRRVLLVEDNEINQQVAQELLGQAGLRVTTVSNGRKAIEAVLGQRFDFVLMDIQMPEMNGLDATRHIRQIDGGNAEDLPIIAMTANAMSGDRDESLAAGMNDHITKPIDPAELYQTLLKWISMRDVVPPPSRPPMPTEATPTPTTSLDRDAGLRRVGGKEELYGQILEKFAHDFSDTPQAIRRCLDAGDTAQAQHLCHTLKGVAGNIGATALHTLSTTLDQQLRQLPAQTPASAEVNELLPQLETELSAVLAAIAARTPTPSAAPAATLQPGNVADLRNRLEKMKPHLQRRQPLQCKRLLEPLAPLTWPAPYDTEIRQLETLIGRYLFKEAEALVDQMLQHP